ncbi:MAG: hypothetical protein IT165_04270 [Bryobacterales bacterium]|nr:hypothetical protein [Bryobacterales bacterium]
MSAANILDALFDPLSLCLDEESARKVIDFRIDPQVQARAGELAERANEGHLTPDECAEYEALVNFTDFLSVFKLKARRHLAEPDGRRYPRICVATG